MQKPSTAGNPLMIKRVGSEINHRRIPFYGSQDNEDGLTQP